MEVRVRRDGSIIYKEEDDSVFLPTRVRIEGSSQEEKIESVKNLFLRVRKRGSTVGTCYKQVPGEGFKPARRAANGQLFLCKPGEKNLGFFDKEDVMSLVVEPSRRDERLNKIVVAGAAAAIRESKPSAESC